MMTPTLRLAHLGTKLINQLIKRIIAILIAITILILLFAKPVQAESPTFSLEDKSIPELITFYAQQYSVSEEVMHTVINCESSYNPRALGDSGNSRGLVQIHAKYHPTVTDEMAYDPAYSIEFLADKLAQKKGHLWTCWRKNYQS